MNKNNEIELVQIGSEYVNVANCSIDKNTSGVEYECFFCKNDFVYDGFDDIFEYEDDKQSTTNVCEDCGDQIKAAILEYNK